MILKFIKKYLVFTGLIANVFLGYYVFAFSEDVMKYQSLPTAIYKAAGKFSNYSVTKPVANVLRDAGNLLYSPVYFWKPFDESQWPTVGPNYQTEPVKITTPSEIVYVSDSAELIKALRFVKPGSTIVVADGNYVLNSKRFKISDQTPSKFRPVVLKAENPGKVNLEMHSLEGIYLNQPYWTITGFRFIGKCKNHNACEHAMHVVGGGQYAEIVNNEFVDFNAAIKVNRNGNSYPDFGRVEYNHFYFTAPRETKYSVTPINIDHANNWVISHNIIRDFIKTGGNQISYGAFMKGGANNGVFENNLVICNSTKRHYLGSSIGLSIGGGGMDDRRNGVAYQANKTTIRNNIIFHCSDVGIYVNNGQDSFINNNTLYNTSGIDIRFAKSSAIVVNNLMSGRLKTRDNGSILVDSGNIVYPRGFFTNSEPLNETFLAPETGNFKIVDKSLDISQGAVGYPTQDDYNLTDFCGKKLTTEEHFIGAFSDRNGCFDTK